MIEDVKFFDMYQVVMFVGIYVGYMSGFGNDFEIEVLSGVLL